MPNRILKESICTSSGLSEVTIFAQDLYKRLITYADDYGRFNCDPIIILARLYPREMDWVTKEDIWEAMEELCLVGKIQFYSVNDRRFVYDLLGYFPNWHDHQRIRESKSKLPAPDKFDEYLNDWALRRKVSLQLRIEVASRDKCICQNCKKNLNPNNINVKRLIKLKDGSLHFDHVIPVRNGGRATMENIQLLCPKCNLSKPKNYTYDDIIKYLRGELPRVAASCGELPLAHARNPIQSESQSESQSKNPPNPPQGGEDAVDLSFERFWDAYPKKADKDEAKKAWKKLRPGTDTVAAILAGVERWKVSRSWTKDNGEYICYPATFLRRRRWETTCFAVPSIRAPDGVKNYDEGKDFFSEE